MYGNAQVLSIGSHSGIGLLWRSRPPQAITHRLRSSFRTAFLVSGRMFTGQDATGDRVAILSESAARFCFPRANPLGQKVRFAKRPNVPEYEIGGIVKDTRAQAVRGDAWRFTYLPIHVSTIEKQVQVSLMKERLVSALATAFGILTRLRLRPTRAPHREHRIRWDSLARRGLREWFHGAKPVRGVGFRQGQAKRHRFCAFRRKRELDSFTLNSRNQEL